MKRKSIGYLYVLPVLIMLALFIFYPMVLGIKLSFFNIHLLKPDSSFVGFGTYKEVLTDSLFLKVLKNTLIYVVTVVPSAVLIALALALALNKDFRYKGLIRALMFIPWVLPEIVIASFWKYMLDGQTGILNEIMVKLGIIKDYYPWFSSMDTALMTAAFVMIWRTYPFQTILLLGGLKVIPKELYDAAKIDGAGTVQSFFYITIPQLKYMLFIGMIIATLWSLQSFGIIYVLTGGGPADSSRVMSIWLYGLAFKLYRVSKASAGSVFMFTTVGILAYFYIRQTRLTKGI